MRQRNGSRSLGGLVSPSATFAASSRRRGRFTPSYDDWTDGELGARAQLLNVPRCGRMSREQLIAALLS